MWWKHSPWVTQCRYGNIIAILGKCRSIPNSKLNDCYVCKIQYASRPCWCGVDWRQNPLLASLGRQREKTRVSACTKKLSSKCSCAKSRHKNVLDFKCIYALIMVKKGNTLLKKCCNNIHSIITCVAAPLFFTVIISSFSQMDRIFSNPRFVFPQPPKFTVVNCGHVAANERMLESCITTSKFLF